MLRLRACDRLQRIDARPPHLRANTSCPNSGAHALRATGYTNEGATASAPMIAEAIQERESRDHGNASESADSGSIVVPEPGRHLPWHARELPARFRAAL